MKKIIFACGGTLGHINPALAVGNFIYNMKKKDWDIYFISTTKEEKNLIYYENNTIKYPFIKEVYYLKTLGYNRKNLINNIKVIINNLKSYYKARKIIKELNPDLVVSMGGSVGTIVGKAAINTKVKTILHEQNAVIGLGNELIMNKAQMILLSYPYKELQNNKKLDEKKTCYVGNPSLYSFYNINNYKKNISKERIILIFGGSNGAKKINDFFIVNKSRLLEEFKNHTFIIFTGYKYFNENVNTIEKNKEKRFQILPQTTNMNDYYQKADVVICRGGATTLAEVLSLRKISIIIPSPNVTMNHQYYNSLYYQKMECLDLILEEDLETELVINQLKKCLCKEVIEKRIKRIEENYIKYSNYLFYIEMEKLIGDKIDE